MPVNWILQYTSSTPLDILVFFLLIFILIVILALRVCLGLRSSLREVEVIFRVLTIWWVEPLLQ